MEERKWRRLGGGRRREGEVCLLMRMSILHCIGRVVREDWEGTCVLVFCIRYQLDGDLRVRVCMDRMHLGGEIVIYLVRS